MANYVLVYHGGAMAETEAAQAEVMQAWTEWFTKLGPAVVDSGNPASRTKRVAGDGGVSDDPSGPSGYSIISAGSIDEAVEFAKSCPVLKGGSTIQVVETFAAM
ncbi:MAG: hypothetical protein ABIP77_00745 [Candidatus Limnocylindrales bacterium]